MREVLCIELYYIVGIKENTTDALDLHQRETRKGSHATAAHGGVTKKTVAQDLEEVKYSLKNVGYHAGDLGKAEPWAQQGRSRGTGHFGTGTYFVGDEAEISGNSTYGRRPHYSVDFTKYNLFKPRNREDGYKLHRMLHNLNKYGGNL